MRAAVRAAAASKTRRRTARTLREHALSRAVGLQQPAMGPRRRDEEKTRRELAGLLQEIGLNAWTEGAAAFIVISEDAGAILMPKVTEKRRKEVGEITKMII